MRKVQFSYDPVGKTIKSSKKRYLWQLVYIGTSDNNTHNITLYKTELNNKVKLIHNGKELVKTKVQNGLKYKFNIDENNTAEIYYQEKRHYLKVNGVKFEDLKSYIHGEKAKKQEGTKQKVAGSGKEDNLIAELQQNDEFIKQQEAMMKSFKQSKPKQQSSQQPKQDLDTDDFFGNSAQFKQIDPPKQNDPPKTQQVSSYQKSNNFSNDWFNQQSDQHYKQPEQQDNFFGDFEKMNIDQSAPQQLQKQQNNQFQNFDYNQQQQKPQQQQQQQFQQQQKQPQQQQEAFDLI